MADPQQAQAQNPAGSLSNIFNYMKQFLGGAGPLQQAAGAPGQQGGGGQQPMAPPQAASIQPGQPNGIMESLGRMLLGRAGSPGSQDTTELKKQIDAHMAVLDAQKKQATAAKQAVQKRGAPQSQIDSSKPYHDLFHSLISNLQG